MSLSNVFKVKVKVKVIEMSMSMYAMHVYRHEQFECHSLNIVQYITIIDLVQVKNSEVQEIRKKQFISFRI